MNSFVKLLKSVKEIGLSPLLLFGGYQFGLRVGHFKRVTLPHADSSETVKLRLPLLPIPALGEVQEVVGSDGYHQIMYEADSVAKEKKFAYFGGKPKLIDLFPAAERDSLQHWTDYETGKVKLPDGDVKFIWEPARLGWAFPLARAYLLSGNSDYRERFWEMLDGFNRANPAMMGPNWTSAQEVAIRLTVLALLSPIFLQNDPYEAEHQEVLSAMLYDHARRIPPTIGYARSQQNNHLITEALGLMVAGKVLDCAQSVHWFAQGFKWICAAFRSQIDAGGGYSQKSNNYHRLMLQCAIVADGIVKNSDYEWPEDVWRKLQAATLWLACEVDPISGQVSNYGHNNGAYLFPYDTCGYADYRPVVQAGSLAFWGKRAFTNGKWNEQALWLGQNIHDSIEMISEDCSQRIGNGTNWLQMRSSAYKIRPGHADQLHVDIWHKGIQVALDAGTYLYNGEKPWENSLMTSRIHNTITVDGQDQMTRAGKFLWLDWSEGKVISSSSDRCEAVHNGYHRLGVNHQRLCRSIIDSDEGGIEGWVIEDQLSALDPIEKSEEHEFTIQWLLPDGDWKLDGNSIVVKLNSFSIGLTIEAPEIETEGIVQVCRAGELIFGDGSCIPQRGWISPYYGEKLPAISTSVTFKTATPFTILSKWRFYD